MRKLFAIIACLLLLVTSQPVVGEEIVEIASDKIVLIEPAFTNYVKEKMPFLMKKLRSLEQIKEPKHINAEFEDFETFWKSVRNYYLLTNGLKANIADFEKEAHQIRNEILKQENLYSSTSIRKILEYKTLNKNIEYSTKSIVTLDQDFDYLFDVLKKTPLVHQKDFKQLVIRPFEETEGEKAAKEQTRDKVPYYDKAISLKSYASILVNALNDVKEKRIDFDEFEKIAKEQLGHLTKERNEAKHIKGKFIEAASDLTGKVKVSKRLDNMVADSQEVFDRFYQYELYVIDNKKVTLASVASALGTIIVLLILNWILTKIILSRYVFDKSKEFAVNTLKKYIIYFAIFIIFLNGIGLDLSKITILVSALSIGMGFGLTTVVSNFISGLFLLLEGTINVGDRLMLEDESIVTVINIGLRKSLLKTLDNVDVLTPNTELVSKKVINLTYKKNFINRHRLPFTASNHVDIDKLEKVAVASVIKTLGGMEKVMAKEPELQFRGVNKDYYDCVLYFYVDYLNNFIPDSLFYKNLLKDFVANGVKIFEDKPLNEVLSPLVEDLRSGKIKIGG